MIFYIEQDIITDRLWFINYIYDIKHTCIKINK